MNNYRFSRLFLFLYDVVRLVLIVSTMTQLGKLSLGKGSYPYLVYTSPQALFPIMAWFVYFDAEKYAGYFPLNIAGKCVSILLTGIWVFNALPVNRAAMSVDFLICLGLTVIIMFADIISILGIVFVRRGLEAVRRKNADNQPAENDSGIHSQANNSNGGM